MPSRPLAVTPVDASGQVNPSALNDVVEHLRRGTREQYESPWTQVEASASASFTHNLEEIPWIVDVMRSEESDGARMEDANADVTVAKSATTVTVTNDAATAYYFKVRAM